MSARDFGARMVAALTDSDPLFRDLDPHQRVAVETPRAALAKARDAAAGGAPGALAVVVEVADQALGGAR